MHQPWALGRGMGTPLNTRFTVGGLFVRHSIINFVPDIGPWVGAELKTVNTRFTVGLPEGVQVTTHF